MLFEPRWFRWTRRIGLSVLVVITVLPIYVMITSSVKSLRDVQQAFQWIPSHITIAPFGQIWTTIPLARYFLNSVIVSVSATLLSVLVAIFAAYGISRFRFPGRQAFLVTVLSTQMFPGILFLLPLFVIYVNIYQLIGLRLYYTLPGLIITYLTFSLPFSIWMLVGYFDTIPRELDEQARVDGTSWLGALVRVVVPSAVPGIVAVAVYAFMTAWGEVLFASVMTTSRPAPSPSDSRPTPPRPAWRGTR